MDSSFSMDKARIHYQTREKPLSFVSPKTVVIRLSGCIRQYRNKLFICMGIGTAQTGTKVAQFMKISKNFLNCR